MKKLSFVLLSVLALLTACSGSGDKKAKNEIMVKTITVTTENYKSNNNYLATIEPELEAGLSFQVPGNVETVFVSEGQFVKKGALLARLSRGHFDNAYSAAKAEYQQAQDAYNRMERLYKTKSLPEMKFIEVQSKWEQAKAQLQSAKKDVGDSHLYAPFDGVVDKKMIEPGVNVGQGMPVINLIKIDNINVKISIPEKDISNIEKGQRVDVEIPVLKKSFTGKITEKNLAANAISQTYEVKVKLANPRHELLSGMVGNARIYSDLAQDYITIPPAAVQLLPNNDKIVWKVGPNNKVQQAPVKTVAQTNDGIQIGSGLSIGDKIIVEGFQKLSDGVSVKEQ